MNIDKGGSTVTPGLSTASIWTEDWKAEQNVKFFFF
jgi:hypothetical protein